VESCERFCVLPDLEEKNSKPVPCLDVGQLFRCCLLIRCLSFLIPSRVHQYIAINEQAPICIALFDPLGFGQREFSTATDNAWRFAIKHDQTLARFNRVGVEGDRLFKGGFGTPRRTRSAWWSRGSCSQTVPAAEPQEDHSVRRIRDRGLFEPSYAVIKTFFLQRNSAKIKLRFC